MWARAIDGVILVSEDFAEQIKNLCTPGTKILVNNEVMVLGGSMDLERTNNDDRFWFYTEDENRSLQINFLRSEDTFEIALIERKTYWFGAMREKNLDLSSLIFPSTNLVVVEGKKE